MNSEDKTFAAFLADIMRRRKCRPSQLAAEIGVNHATVSRWLRGREVPNISSCRKLAEYCGVPLEKVLAVVGHLPMAAEGGPSNWPEFREYAKGKYPKELDEDLVTVIEGLIERRRGRKYDTKEGSRLGDSTASSHKRGRWLPALWPGRRHAPR